MTENLGLVVWFCGLSGAGKTTIATAAAKILTASGLKVLMLDGDNVRNQIHTNLGFTKEDIIENNRLISSICERERFRNDVVLVPIISPLDASRKAARAKHSPGFSLVFCNTSLEIAATRDVKGLYSRADNGDITDLVGYSKDGVPFEWPSDADLTLNTGHGSIQGIVNTLCAYLTVRLANVIPDEVH